MYFLHTGTVPFPNPNFCNFWNWYQYTFVSINLLVIAFSSLERYLLVFHHRFLSNHSILLRQIPLLISILFPTIFYTVGIFGIPCQATYNFNAIACGSLCFTALSPIANIFKNIILVCLPVIFTILISILLIIRVYIQRRKMQRQRQFWKESIQMILQLIPIIILYLIIWIPMSILFYFVTFGSISERKIALPLVSDVFGHIKYLVNLVCPFLVLLGQPEIRQKVKRIICCLNPHRRQTIAPAIVTPVTLNNHTLPLIRA